MGIDRRKLIGAGLASIGTFAGKAGSEPHRQPDQPQFIVPHGGDCCGCAISKEVGTNKYQIVCNECGEDLDVMVSESTYRRMAEALERAMHALAFAYGHVAQRWQAGAFVFARLQ